MLYRLVCALVMPRGESENMPTAESVRGEEVSVEEPVRSRWDIEPAASSVG